MSSFVVGLSLMLETSLIQPCRLPGVSREVLKYWGSISNNGACKMPKFYVKWQLNPLATPPTPQERVGLWLKMLEMVKADMQAGKTRDWGQYADGSGGYALMDAASETELFTSLLKWMPYVSIDAKADMTADQTIESIKKVAAQVK